ncbi:MAG: hypothetical protein HC854_08660 [Flavobacterium sp.]|nr:hypothetical protein [Flavobacterium sp.]
MEDGIVEAVEVSEYYDGNLKEEEKIKTGSTYIIQKNNKFFSIENIDNKIDTTLIKLPRRIKNASIVKTNLTITNDTLSLKNETALLYTYKDKKGIYF